MFFVRPVGVFGEEEESVYVFGVEVEGETGEPELVFACWEGEGVFDESGGALGVAEGDGVEVGVDGAFDHGAEGDRVDGSGGGGGHGEESWMGEGRRSAGGRKGRTPETAAASGEACGRSGVRGEFGDPVRDPGLVAVVFRLVRAFDGNADVVGLFLGEGGELDPDFFEVETSDFFVELLGEDADHGAFGGVVLAVFPEVELGERLVGEAVGHDEGRVSGGAAEIDETAFGEHVDAVAGGERVAVELRLDVEAFDAGEGVELVDFDFVIEVADVSDAGLVFHFGHVFDGDDAEIAGGGDVDVGAAEGVLDRGDLIAFHGGLEGVDGVDFGDDDASALAAEGLGGTLADIAVAADDGDLAGDHDIEGAVETVDERVAAAVEVVELGLGDAVVDVEGWDEEFAGFGELVETVDARGGFFGDPAPFLDEFVEDEGVLGVDVAEEVFDDLFFVGAARGIDPAVAFFEFVALVEEEGDVAAVIDDELWAFAVAVDDGLPCAVPVFFEGFALPCEDGDTGGGDGCGGVVLSGEDVAGGPTDGGTEFLEGFDEDRGLDGHVEGAGDADASERFFGGVALTDGHEAWHFLFGDVDFLAAPVGKGDVGDVVVGAGGAGDGGLAHRESGVLVGGWVWIVERGRKTYRRIKIR